MSDKETKPATLGIQVSSIDVKENLMQRLLNAPGTTREEKMNACLQAMEEKMSLSSPLDTLLRQIDDVTARIPSLVTASWTIREIEYEQRITEKQNEQNEIREELTEIKKLNLQLQEKVKDAETEKSQVIEQNKKLQEDFDHLTEKHLALMKTNDQLTETNRALALMLKSQSLHNDAEPHGDDRKNGKTEE